MTDQHPEEIAWKVYDSAGEVVCQGGPYSEARKKQVIGLPLGIDDCYLLEFEDSGNDGIEDGRGYYMLHEVNSEGKARLLVQQTYSEAIHDVFFSLQLAQPTGVEPVAAAQQQAPQAAYDLQGRKIARAARGIIITQDKKVINK